MVGTATAVLSIWISIFLLALLVALVPPWLILIRIPFYFYEIAAALPFVLLASFAFRRIFRERLVPGVVWSLASATAIWLAGVMLDEHFRVTISMLFGASEYLSIFLVGVLATVYFLHRDAKRAAANG